MNTILGDRYKLEVERLKGANYYKWSNEMEVLHRRKGNGKFSDPNALHVASKVNKVATEKSDFALPYFIISINRSCKPSVIHLRNRKDVWEKL